ncbi:hypothetical protein BDA96_09G037600 [Sorghum bicolor]|uniref:Uncharacterized protein n=1 Tax=Sorghum bicolor TaxID=4558 RepID=A0A921U3P4_SORBI|nr:hypothetical protein BDA96_09G037600 [Sorghum bicolor]
MDALTLKRVWQFQSQTYRGWMGHELDHVWHHHNACVVEKRSRNDGAISIRCMKKNLAHFAPQGTMCT